MHLHREGEGTMRVLTVWPGGWVDLPEIEVPGEGVHQVLVTPLATGNGKVKPPGSSVSPRHDLKFLRRLRDRAQAG